MKIRITDKDVINLQKFMVNHSKKAKKQKLVSFYAIPFEFILVGLILDGFFKLVPWISITSLVLAILWLVFYPKYYKRLCKKQIDKAIQNTPKSNIEMNLKIDKNNISFSPDEKPKISEIFEISTLNKLAKSENNFFLGFKAGHHIVLPITDETQEEIIKLSKKLNLNILLVEL
ncbi:putative membrane protein [Campylobacter blaseri]|uniref:YcxB-like protein domain-containing protein n=1 Tax=Campylobacter blaseri TaxID=2042961 RepID=A0A2P8R181_9BACT|nr:hypothetical protein [Campylobacter blaseri]PSM52257.1 hypothetical protein CQ405_04160 [Campylobacter blaseri]PSM54023.1 hypothetical protein CRN67_04160 [Campylobacter blaseri]QKF85461.1 putative membrane protein [Campylobacter blaseri]